VLTATSHNALPTQPTMTHPTLSASILEPMPQTAVQYTPSPSKASQRQICSSTQAMHENDVMPAKALEPGPAVPPVLQPTRSLQVSSVKNMTKTQI